jgi:peptidoglycan-associated lipoprotein
MRFLLLITSILLALSACKTGEIRDGQVAWQYKKYALAAELLKKDYNKASGQEKANLAYQIAESYRFTNRPEPAARWYRTALELGVQQDAALWLGRMLMATADYDGALLVFNQILRDEPYRRVEIRQYIAACEQALAWQGTDNNTRIVNLADLNSPQTDFGIALYSNDRVVFVSSRPGDSGDKKDQWTGQSFFDLYVAERKSITEFSKPEPFDAVFNEPFNDGPIAFNNSFTEAFFTRCGTTNMQVNDFCGIWYSRREPDGGWSTPEMLELFEDSVNVGQPTVSRDGNLLIFAATEPQGFGGSDLYYSVRTFEGWSPPINLGRQINTPGDEAFPWLDAEGNLWFSSNGRPGLGGLDIYMARQVDRNRWANPRHLDHPVNSSGDDFGIVVLPLTRAEEETFYLKGYFSSSRSGGKGGDDMYYFEHAKPDARYLLLGTVFTLVYADSTDPASAVVDTVPLKDARVAFSRVTASGEMVLDAFTTGSNGEYETDLQANTDYSLLAGKEPTHFARSDRVTTKGKVSRPGEVDTITSVIILDRIFPEKEIVIPNIYYDFNEWNIRPDAAEVLDTTIFVLLEENPNVTIELGSHTDSRGSSEFNMELSQKRAQSVVDYLARKGIDPARLTPKGYGESQLVNHCADGIECDEDQHQKNRRTTFRVLSADGVIESVQPDEIELDPERK